MDPAMSSENAIDIGFTMQNQSTAIRKRLLPPAYKLVLVALDLFFISASFLLVGFLADPLFFTVDAAIKIVFTAFLCLLTLSFFQEHRLYSHHYIFLKSNHFAQLGRSYAWTLTTFLIISATYISPETFSSRLVVLAIFLMAVGVTLFSRFMGNQLINLVKSFGVAFFTVGILGFSYPELSPFSVISWQTIFAGLLLSMAVVGVVRLFIVHTVFNLWLRRQFRRQALIIGSDDEASRIASHVIDLKAPYWIAGTIGDQDLNLAFHKSRLGDFERLPSIVMEKRIDEIIVTDELMDKRALISLLDFSISEGITVWFPPKLMPVIDAKLQPDNFCGLPMIRLCTQRNRWISLKLKHVFDALVTLPGFLVLLPLFLGISLAVKMTSKGPVFYRANAIGKGGRPFSMYKFRTMRVDSDPGIHKEYVTNLIQGKIENDGKTPLKIVDDPRITSVGKWLRKLSLDELPQLLNVLKGDMSLVGPRPCLPYEYEIYKDWHKKRTAVRPGISGLWQVAGRSEVQFEDMILLDLYYIYNRSFLTDLNILYETFYVILGKKGAF